MCAVKSKQTVIPVEDRLKNLQHACTIPTVTPASRPVVVSRTPLEDMTDIKT